MFIFICSLSGLLLLFFRCIGLICGVIKIVTPVFVGIAISPINNLLSRFSYFEFSLPESLRPILQILQDP